MHPLKLKFIMFTFYISCSKSNTNIARYNFAVDIISHKLHLFLVSLGKSNSQKRGEKLVTGRLNMSHQIHILYS